ncbi:NepR family anti-sigma factor [Qipengyuania sp. CAU 1752]
MQPKSSKKDAPDPGAKKAKEGQPEWANGLRQLYDSVVEEPLPDSFKDLLSKLDEPSDGGGSNSD